MEPKFPDGSLLVAVRYAGSQFGKLRRATLQAPFNAGEVLGKQPIVRRQLARHSQLSSRLRKTASPGQCNREGIADIRVLRHKSGGLLQMSYSFSGAVLSQQGASQIVVSIRIVRAHFQGDAELSDSLVQLVLEEKRKTIVELSERIGRIEANGLAKPLSGLRELTLLEQGCGLVIVGFGQGGVFFLLGLDAG